MAYEHEDSDKRQEIQSSLKSIVESSESWLMKLQKRQFRVRLATSFLVTLFAFAVIAISLLIYLFVSGQLFDLISNQNLVKNLSPVFRLVGFAGLGGLASGFITYFILRRRHGTELKEVSNLITQMKKTQQVGENTSSSSGGGITVDALSLTDKVFSLLPEVARKRNRDQIIFGLAAFILGLFTGNFAVAFLAGVIVWVYSRYETRKTY